MPVYSNFKEKAVIEDLEAHGITNSRLQEEILAKIRLGLPEFTLSHAESFEKHTIRYQLHFSYDPAANDCSLKSYDALYRDIPIEHATINGIDTEELEDRMKEVDWKEFFLMPGPYAKHIKGIAEDLWMLSQNDHQQGKLIRDQLRIKYWTDTPYDSDSLDDLRKQFEFRRSVRSPHKLLFTPGVDYHLLNGNLEDLKEKLKPFDLDSIPEYDLSKSLEQVLRYDPEKFHLRCLSSFDEGVAEYGISIHKDLMTEKYEVGFMNVRLTKHPEIEHGVFNTVDTRELEEQMQQINWHDDAQLFIIKDEENLVFDSQVERIFLQMQKLQGDSAGRETANRLQLKYWIGATFVDSLIPTEAWKLLDSLPKEYYRFDFPITARQAYNLLCGRAVFPLNQPSALSDKAAQWIKLRKDSSGTRSLIPLKYSNEKLRTDLSMIPVVADNAILYGALRSLRYGDITPVELKNGRQVLLKADPENQTIAIYTLDEKRIQANLQLESDWHPIRVPESRKTKFSKKPNRRKGPGL